MGFSRVQGARFDRRCSGFGAPVIKGWGLEFRGLGFEVCCACLRKPWEYKTDSNRDCDALC